MNCCAECFGDRGLRRSIIPSRSAAIGRCSYCESDGVSVIEPKKLTEYFELLVSAYRPDGSGKLLVHWFREDWALFQHPRMDDSRAKNLLSEILDDGEITRQTFVPANDPTPDRLSEWENLRDELMYHNRYFPEKTVDLDRLEALLSPLTLDADELPTVWYRARIRPGDVPYTVDQMGAPPKRIASHARANPAGIPYLYLGSAQETAISEIRPHTGEIACVADFTIPTTLNLSTSAPPGKWFRLLCWQMPMISDACEMTCRFWSVWEMNLRDPSFRSQQRLTTPRANTNASSSRSADTTVSSTAVRSGTGMNLALFDPSLATWGTVAQYRVVRIAVEIELDPA